MKKHYTEPEIEVVQFVTEDIITTSDFGNSEYEPGEGYDDIE